MLLAKSVDHDTRVLKEAASLARSGADVTIISRAATEDEAGITSQDGIRFARRVFTDVIASSEALRNRATGTGPFSLRHRLPRWSRGLTSREASQYAA